MSNAWLFEDVFFLPSNKNKHLSVIGGWKKVKSTLWKNYTISFVSFSRPGGSAREKHEAEMTHSLMFLSLVYLVNSFVFPIAFFILQFAVRLPDLSAPQEKNIVKQVRVSRLKILIIIKSWQTFFKRRNLHDHFCQKNLLLKTYKKICKKNFFS